MLAAGIAAEVPLRNDEHDAVAASESQPADAKTAIT